MPSCAASARCCDLGPRWRCTSTRCGSSSGASHLECGVLGIIIPAGWRQTGDSTLHRHLWRSVNDFDGAADFNGV